MREMRGLQTSATVGDQLKGFVEILLLFRHNLGSGTATMMGPPAATGQDLMGEVPIRSQVKDRF